MKPSTIDLAVASNSPYLPGLLVTLGSAAASLSGDYRIQAWVLDSGLSDADWAFLCQRLDIYAEKLHLQRIPIDAAKFDHISPGINGNHGTYARLLIPELINSPKVIYLDVDFLVLKNLGALQEIDLQGNTFAAVPDQFVPAMAWDWEDTEAARITSRYFNTGLLVMDTEAWRRNDLTRRSLDFLAQHKPRTEFHDQSALNALCSKGVLFLPNEWNLHGLTGFMTVGQGAVMDTCIHYAGKNPWGEFLPGLAGALWYWCYELLSGTSDAIQTLNLEESRASMEKHLGQLVRKRFVYQLIGNYNRFNKTDAEISRARFDPYLLRILQRHLEQRITGQRLRS